LHKGSSLSEQRNETAMNLRKRLHGGAGRLRRLMRGGTPLFVETDIRKTP
jgi:hypothetical protein